jgi:hypothetical protein
MRPIAVLACLLSICLVSACWPAANVPVAPDPKPTPTALAQAAPVDSNPFPRLANPQPGQTLEIAEYFADPYNGIKVQQLTVTGGTDADADGALDYQVQAKVDLGEKGVHDVEIAEEVAPFGSGLPDVFTVMDRTATRSFVFELSSDGSQAVIRQGVTTLRVTIAADETYSLDDQAPMDVEAASSQILEGALKDSLTPHALALLYSKLLRTETDRAQAYRTQHGAMPVSAVFSISLLLIYMTLIKALPMYVPVVLLV